jgi:hypothetical protein
MHMLDRSREWSRIIVDESKPACLQCAVGSRYYTNFIDELRIEKYKLGIGKLNLS